MNQIFLEAWPDYDAGKFFCELTNDRADAGPVPEWLAARLRAIGLEALRARAAAAETDMQVVCTGTGDFVEIQGTAEREPFSRAMLGQLLDLATGGCAELSRLQAEALGG